MRNQESSGKWKADGKTGHGVACQCVVRSLPQTSYARVASGKGNRQKSARWLAVSLHYTLHRALGFGNASHAERAASLPGLPSIAYANCLPSSTPG